MTATIRVDGPAPYDVEVGHGVFDRFGDMVGDAGHKVAVIHPAGLDLAASLPTDTHEVLDLALPDGEAAKSVEVVNACWERLGEAGFTRSDVVVTIGGGATTDVGGFVAATWLRGVRVIHFPTTLLAMVDAAVGGKTGINTTAGKNLVGAFHEPAGVVCELEFLASLPRAELVSGMAEVVKCGFIADPEILRLVEADPDAALDPAGPVLAELVERAVRVKAEVVGQDLKESGLREILNYGHTMGHAVERWSDFGLRHGEAVALGMVYVAELARLAGRLDDATAARHRAVLDLVGLPTSWPASLPPATFEELLPYLAVDKKARGGTIRFVVLEALSEPARLEGPERDLLETAFEAIR